MAILGVYGGNVNVSPFASSRFLLVIIVTYLQKQENVHWRLRNVYLFPRLLILFLLESAIVLGIEVVRCKENIAGSIILPCNVLVHPEEG